MPLACKCKCHNWPRGTQRACMHAEHYMTAFDWAQRASVWEYHMSDGVDVGDVIEAAFACQVCLRLHTPALSGHPLRRPPERKSPPDQWTDQADGTNRD